MNFKYQDVHKLATKWAANDGLWLTQTDTQENLIRFAYEVFLQQNLTHSCDLVGATEEGKLKEPCDACAAEILGCQGDKG